jgi:PAS domain S-box-containing protein
MHPRRAWRSTRGLAVSNGPGGAIVRRLLPTTVALLVTIGVLRWQGESFGLYGSTTGIVLMTVSAIAVIVAVLWHFARWLERDEAARVAAEAQLRTSARHFELSRDLHCTAGFDGYFRQLNAAWTETLGWSEEELQARPFVDFVHPDDRAMTVREASGLADGAVTTGFVNRYETKGGGWRWIDWQATSDAADGVIYASARDVTHNKHAEAALAASERQTRAIIETAHDAFVSMNAEGLICDWNPRAQVTFGWSRAEAVGHELAELIIPERDRAAHRTGLARFLATGEHTILSRRLELTALRRDASEFLVELTISPVASENGPMFNAFLRDITESTRAQEELALARDQAIEASNMKSMFVANVSHEIRTPMNGVIGMTELLLDTALDAEQREYVDTISSSGEALLGIIDDILDFSKIEAGRLELDPTEFSLRDMIERTCGMLTSRAHGKGLEFVVAIDPDVPALVYGDAARLAQVIANFGSNAIKFTAAGEVVVHATSRPEGDDMERVTVTVADSGIGIDRDALGRLFTPFSQADGSTTRKYGGTGLGLAISRHLIELMGGRVGADSVVGEGSMFWLEVLLERRAPAAAPAQAGEENAMAGMAVLVVDHDGAGRLALERQLSSWEMRCHVTDDTAEALATLESAAGGDTPFALALLDVDMLDGDVYELGRQIRARPALGGVRLVLLTSFGGPGDMPDGTDTDGLLTKPVRASRLYDELRAVIGGEPPPARRRRAAVPIAEARDAGRERPILVVEDTLVNQVVAVKMLARCGFRAHIAENGLDALDALDAQDFAAVLMDCQMPALDGYETTQEIRRRELGGPRIPIIAMTANSMQGERERCLKAGMDDYLAKPLRKQLLQRALTRWTVQTPTMPGVAPSTPAEAPAAAPAAVGAHLLDETIIGELEGLDSAMLSNISSLYFAQVAGEMAVLGIALDTGDLGTVGEVAHKLKGSSYTLGATHVAAVLAEIEAAAKGGDIGDGAELLVRLRRGLADTQSALALRGDALAPSTG